MLHREQMFRQEFDWEIQCPAFGGLARETAADPSARTTTSDLMQSRIAAPGSAVGIATLQA
jgi:hypothetical protein